MNRIWHASILHNLTYYAFAVLAPTAMSFMGQDFIANHMKSHYRRITSAKGVLLLFLFSDKKILIIVYTRRFDSSELQTVRLHSLKILTPLEFLLIFLVDCWQSVVFSQFSRGYEARCFSLNPYFSTWPWPYLSLHS